MSIILFLVLAIHSIAFYAAIRNMISDKGRFIYLSILVTFLPIAWVLNGGLTGSLPMYYFIYFTASILSLSRRYRNYFIVYIIILTIIPLYIQTYHLDIITPYSSDHTQLFDMKYSFIQIIITTILLTTTYTSINDDIQAKLITHKERLQKSYIKLAAAKECAEEAAATKTNFITNISHEIRTPLTGIIGITNLLEASPLDNNQKLLIHSLDASSKTLLDLVNNLLDLSKIDANKLKLNNETFNIKQSIEEINDLMVLQIREKHVILKTIIADNIKENIHLDKSKYKQVLTNLLSNAIKFTPKGTVTCTISFDDTSSTLITSVEDSGMGIEKKDFHKIFAPFTQLHRATVNHQNNGVGMGLTISKKMVELMEGNISFNSTIHKGSTFTFEVPLAPPAIALHNSHSEVHEHTVSKSLHILIAEDNKINQMVLAKMMEKLHHTYHLADNGQEAIEMCKENSYDAILMDIQMPVVDGIEASKAIFDYYQSINTVPPKLIICSANVFSLRDQPLLNNLATDFLTKPISLTRIRTVLSNV